MEECFEKPKDGQEGDSTNNELDDSPEWINADDSRGNPREER